MKQCYKTFLMAAGLVFFGGCSSVAAPVATPTQPILKETSNIALDWTGVYEGKMRCEGCESTKVRLALYPDRTYVITQSDALKSSKPYHNLGTFFWDEQGKNIILKGGKEANVWYAVRQDKLIILDKEQKPLSQKISDENVLSKIPSESVVPQGVEGVYWKLTSLGKKPLDASTRFPYIFLQKSDKRFYGFAGCNRVTGQYKIISNDNIAFPNAISTKMMCQDISVEQGFLALLNAIKTYEIKGTHMSAFDTNKTLLGTFELIPVE